MKKYSILLLCMFGLFIFSACQEDKDTNPRYNTPDTFVLNTPKYAAGYYELINTETIQLTCSQPNYGFAAAANYTVQVSTDNNFDPEKGFVEADQTLSTIYNECKMDVDAKELDIAICRALKVTGEEDMPTEPIKVYIRLKSEITGVANSAIYSNVITLDQVIPYYALPDVTLPTEMYMMGAFCGWEWANSAKMIEVNGTPDRFWVIRYVKAGEGFKFSTVKSWDGGHNFALENVTVTNTVAGAVTELDGNITIEKSGWYIFSVTTSIVGRDYHHTLDILAPNVYVYGAANGGSFGNDPAWKFEVIDDPDAEFPFVSPTVLPTSGSDESCLRLCIHPEEWNGIDWWKTEFIYFTGKLAYRANGGDQARIANVAGKVYLNFVTGNAKCE